MGAPGGRRWHSGGTNITPTPRASIVARYCPWWLSTEFSRGRHGFGACNNAVVPREVYDGFSDDAKLLFRHNAEGVADGLHVQKHLQGIRNSATWASETRRSNAHITEYADLGPEALRATRAPGVAARL